MHETIFFITIIGVGPSELKIKIGDNYLILHFIILKILGHI